MPWSKSWSMWIRLGANGCQYSYREIYEQKRLLQYQKITYSSLNKMVLKRGELGRLTPIATVMPF